MPLAIGSRGVHKQAPMSPSPELIQVTLAVLGWLVAFLLGKELAVGFLQWRAQRRDNDKRWP
jgi:hypothetical protein